MRIATGENIEDESAKSGAVPVGSTRTTLRGNQIAEAHAVMRDYIMAVGRALAITVSLLVVLYAFLKLGISEWGLDPVYMGAYYPVFCVVSIAVALVLGARSRKRRSGQ